MESTISEPGLGWAYKSMLKVRSLKTYSIFAVFFFLPYFGWCYTLLD